MTDWSLPGTQTMDNKLKISTDILNPLLHIVNSLRPSQTRF